MFSMGHVCPFSKWQVVGMGVCFINWVVLVSSCLSQAYFRIGLPRSCGSYHPRF